jgi:hypothetical protein
MFRNDLAGGIAGAALLLTAACGPGLAGEDFFPTSSESLITKGELANASCDELWQARNEIYAREGYKFETARGIAAFGSGGTTSNPKFNPTEQKNIAMIKEYEARNGCS